MSPPWRNRTRMISDILAPAVSITSPGNGASITTAVNLTASVTDIGSGVKQVQWQVDGVNFGAVKTVAPYTQSFDPNAYGIGNHTITAIATDNVGNVGSSSITVAVNSSRLKDISWPGRNSTGNNDSGIPVHFNTVNSDQWGTGISDQVTFYVPWNGTYSLWFQVNQPGYNQGGVGFGNGWSGDGHGAAWIYTNRYGTHDYHSWSQTGNDSVNEVMTCSVAGVALLAGDYIQCWTSGGATGVSPQNWDAHAQFTRTGP